MSVVHEHSENPQVNHDLHRIDGRPITSPQYIAAGKRPIVDVVDRETHDFIQLIPATEYSLMKMGRGLVFSESNVLHEIKLSPRDVKEVQINQATPQVFEDLFASVATYSLDLDTESKLHEIRSSYIARYLAGLIGIDTNSRLFRYFLIGALVHDDGKGDINIKRRIRIKGALTDEDRAITHLHPLIGTVRALLNGLDGAAEYPLTHHAFFDRESENTLGYPKYINDSNITGVRKVDANGNISSIADEMQFTDLERSQYIFLKEILKMTDEIDAFCSRRIYRDNRLTRQELLEHLQKNAGSRFNPEAVNLVVNNIDELRFFHYLMYRLHNQMTTQMDLSQINDVIENSIMLERTADGSITMVNSPPTMVSWTEMSSDDIIKVIESTTELYNEFNANIKKRYQSKLRRISSVRVEDTIFFFRNFI